MSEPKSRITKPCRDCGKPLVVRANRETGQKFLGCSQYPQCQHTEPMAEDLLLRANGAPTFPGME